MPRAATLAIALAFLSCPALAGEREPPPPTRVRYRFWLVPPYLLVGLPRDVIDAPSKALSSIPLFNKVFIAPLAILNALTSVTSWSFTRYGIDGGFEAWIDCLGLRRKKGSPAPPPMRDRPWWRNYFPNWRSFGIVTREPRAQ